MKNVEIVRAAGQDIPEIISLFRSYDFALIRKQWLWWKYFQNPAGDALMFKVLNRSKLVGAVAIIPQVFTFSGKEIIGLQTVDGLLGMEIRGQGFFNELMHFLSTQRPEGVPEKSFYLSFPSLAVSVKAHENAGWRRLADFGLITALLNPELVFRKKGMVAVGKYMALPWKMIKRAFMFAPADGISVNDVSGRLSDLNDYLPEGFVAGDRSAAFMKWRVGENPRDRMTMLEFQKEGNPVGYAICKFVHRCVEITEIRGTRQNDRRIIAALLRYIDSNKLADSVDFWTLGNSSANLHPTGPGFFKRHFTGSLFIKHHRRCRLPDEPNRWAISYLDSDW